MKPYLEMQKGYLRALIYNIPYNLASDEGLVDYTWHIGEFIWDLIINFLTCDLARERVCIEEEK